VIGHKWEPAEGTILHRNDTYSGLPGRQGSHVREVYDVEVRKADGTTYQVQVPSNELRRLGPGTMIRLEVNDKTGEVRLHPHAGKLVIGFDPSVSTTSDGFGGTAAGPVGTGLPDVSVAGLNVGELLSGNFPPGMQVHVTGGQDMTEMLRSLRSGDPGQRSAAMHQLMQMGNEFRDAVRSQGTQVFMTGYSQTVGPGQPGDAGQPASFGQPGGTGQPGSIGQPGGTAPRSPADRIAMLQEMVDRGQLSQADFDAKRQQILDEI
jgi:hypothetical protein